MKILLLNPPSDRLILRDYCCSETSKADYYWPPIDLLVLSGTIAQKHEVFALDANVTRLTHKEAASEIAKIKPEFIISLIGAASAENDYQFLRRVKRKIKCPIFVLGDVAYFEPRITLEMFPEIDGIIFEFASKEILKYLDGEKRKLKDLAYRSGKKLFIFPKNSDKELSYPLPLHNIFPINKYRLPFAKYHPVSSVLATSYGCPFKCTYCPSGQLNFKLRDIDEFIDELKFVVALGIKEVFIRDFTLNASKPRLMEMCQKISNNRLDIAWDCEARVDLVDRELLTEMKKAGCNTIMFGVETFSNDVQKDTNKHITVKKSLIAFRLCKEIGITTLGHFILGLPGEDENSIKNTIDFSINIGCDYASYNLYVPRFGTQLRKKFVSSKKITQENLLDLDCSEDGFATAISQDKLRQLHKKALRKFYLRPSYMYKAARNIRTKQQFANLVGNGLSVVKMGFKSKS